MGACCSGIDEFFEHAMDVPSHRARWNNHIQQNSDMIKMIDDQCSHNNIIKHLVYSDKPVIYYETKESMSIDSPCTVYTYNDPSLGQLYEPDWNKI